MASTDMQIRIKSPVRIEGVRKVPGSVVTVRRFDALSMISAGTAEFVSGDPGEAVDGKPVKVAAKAKAPKSEAAGGDKAKAADEE